MNAGLRGALALAAVVMLAAPALATVEMQVQAKKLGVEVTGNCLYCHAHSHSIEVMRQKAKTLSVNDGNCLACHGGNIPSKLNDRGRWLVAEKTRRGAKQCDMAWLREYKEPTPAPGAAPARRP